MYPIYVCACAWGGQKTHRGILKSMCCQPTTLPSTGGLRKNPFVIFGSYFARRFSSIFELILPLPTFDRLIDIASPWGVYTEPCACLGTPDNFCGHHQPFSWHSSWILGRMIRLQFLTLCNVPRMPQADCLQILSVTFVAGGFPIHGDEVNPLSH